MTSVVAICNLALSHVGKDTISSIDEASAEARYCRQFYAISRDTMLQSYPWRWAQRTDALAEVTNAKGNLWQFAYQRPSDCLKIHKVLDETLEDYIPSTGGLGQGGGHKYEVEGRVIYCNVSPAFLRYTRAVEDPALFPPLFADALSWALAARLAMPVARDPRLRADAITMARNAAGEAQMIDANEARETSDAPADWIEARGPEYSSRKLTAE